MLVAAGSSLTIKDHQSFTAQSLANKAGDSELSQYLESKCPEQRRISITETCLDMGLLCSLFEEVEPGSESNNSNTIEPINEEDKTCYSDSTSSSSERLDDDSDTTFDRTSIGRGLPYKKMSKESIDFNFDISASSSSTLTEKPPPDITVRPEISVSPSVSSEAYTTVIVPSISSPNVVISPPVVKIDSDVLAPVHEVKSLSNSDEFEDYSYSECPDCVAEKSALSDQLEELLQDVKRKPIVIPEFKETPKRKTSDVEAAVRERERKISSISDSIITRPSVTFETPPSVAPVHSRSIKSFLKSKSKKFDYGRFNKTNLLSSRISQSLRSSYSLRSSKSSTNVRALGGSMRNTWSSDHCGSLVVDTISPPSVSQLGSSCSSNRSSPSATPCVSPLPPLNFGKERRASSVVLALAATQASSFALAYSSLKFPPILTPETIAHTQAITQALTDVLIEEEQRLMRQSIQKKLDDSPKRIKLERLI